MNYKKNNESALIETLFNMAGITPEMIRKELQHIIDTAAQPIILFWDVEDIMKATTFSRAFLEEHIFPDPRVKRYERQREHRGKRVWLKEPTAKVIQEIIMNEWI